MHLFACLLPIPVACQEVTFSKKTGIQTPGVQHTMEELPKTATIAVKGDPDTLAVASDAVWVTSENTDSVIRLDPGKKPLGNPGRGEQAMFRTGGWIWELVGSELRGQERCSLRSGEWRAAGDGSGWAYGR